MLDAAGGGGTAWESMDLDTMQRLIQSASTEKQWEIVTGWKKSAELLSEHRFQVEDYRDNLAAAWPPEKSAASAAYLARLDALIANLTETYEATLANHDAISLATGSIYQAQVKMNKIYEEYQSNKTALDNFTAKQASPTPRPSPSPSGEQPPVAPGRQEQLRFEAATLLSTVSTDLAQAQVRVVRPTAYEPNKTIGKDEEINDGPPYTAPPIPPITTTFDEDRNSTSRSSRPSTAFPTSPGTPTPPPGVNVGPQQPGLVLGGTTTPLPPPSTGAGPISPAFPGGPGPTTSPGLMPGSGILPRGTGAAPHSEIGSGRNLGGGPREGFSRSSTRIPEGIRTIAPGGIIGGTPGVGQPTSGRPGTRKINPVGGVIGDHEGSLGSKRGTGAAGMSSPDRPSGLYGQGGGRRAGRDEDDGMHWDPDNPWETAEGVAPVVMPSRPQRIDPGPAIGLG